MAVPDVPKIELHVHLEGAIRASRLREIARRNRRPLPADPIAALASVDDVTSAAAFQSAWAVATSCLDTVDDFRQIVVDYAAEAATFGAVYVEGMFSPCELVQRGVSWDSMFTGYTEGVAEALDRHGLTVRLTPDLPRDVDAGLAEACARVAVRFRDRGVVGIGGRVGLPTAHYRRAWDIARDGGLGIVPHAGPTAEPDAIRAVLAMQPARFGHCLRVVDDRELMAELVERGVVVDVCLTSNLRLGEVPTAVDHPLARMRAAGVLCTINTDDPAIFDTDLGRESDLASELGVSAADAYAAGWAGMLCDDATRARLPVPSPAR